MDLLKNALSEWNIDISEKQTKSFSLYYELLIEWNEKINLTTIVEKDDVIIKHFVDSLALLQYVDLSDKNMIDIGTGAGFPGIPIKIMKPECKIVLLDSLNKRISFLDHVISELGLTDIKTLHGRAEDVANDPGHRESYDIVLSRAVANLSTLSEYDLPFAKTGGLFISYKSGNVDEEVEGSKRAVSKLGGCIDRIERFILPCSDNERSLIFIDKKNNTPSGFPRKAGTPGKKPL